MSHADTARAMFDLMSSGDLDGFGAVIADDFVEHEELPGFPTTKASVIQMFSVQRAAFPDLKMTAEDVLELDGKVVIRGRMSGTQTGEFMGIPASGRRVDFPLIDIIRFGEDGLAHEHWGVMDTLGMMQQLGVVPPMPVG